MIKIMLNHSFKYLFINESLSIIEHYQVLLRCLKIMHFSVIKLHCGLGTAKPNDNL